MLLSRSRHTFRHTRKLIKLMSDATYIVVGDGVPADQYPEIVRQVHRVVVRRLDDFPALSDMDEERLFRLVDQHVRSQIRMTMDGVILIDKWT